jgi:predicted O-methyltransferase YrrM
VVVEKRAIKKLIPIALKQPVRAYVDARNWRTQPRLPFAGKHLRPVSEISIPAIMNDPAISAAFAEDHARISEVYGAGEISGGVNPGDRRALYHLVAHFKPQSILEIGTHVGASTIYLASASQRFGGSLTTADIVDVNGPSGAWRTLGMPAPPRDFIERLGLSANFITTPAAEMLLGPRRYDLIFLDGDHSARAVYREISAALGPLNPGGLILLHDFYPDCKPLTPDGAIIDGPAAAAARIKSESADLGFLPLGDLPWETKGGGNATSLALVAATDYRTR